MKSIFVFAVLVVLATASLSLWSADEVNGAQLFKAKCSPCHGENGEGKPAINMPAAQGTAMSVDEIVKYLTMGESGTKIHSKPMGALNDEEAKAVAEHVKSLK
jgi:cytochrome c553